MEILDKGNQVLCVGSHACKRQAQAGSGWLILHAPAPICHFAPFAQATSKCNKGQPVSETHQATLFNPQANVKTHLSFLTRRRPRLFPLATQKCPMRVLRRTTTHVPARLLLGLGLTCPLLDLRSFTSSCPTTLKLRSPSSCQRLHCQTIQRIKRLYDHDGAIPRSSLVRTLKHRVPPAPQSPSPTHLLPY